MNTDMLSEMAKKYIVDKNRPKYTYALQSVYADEHKPEYNKDIYKFSKEELTDCLIRCFSTLSKSTVNSYIPPFRQFFKWIENNGIYKFNYDYKTALDEIEKTLLKRIKLVVYKRKNVYNFAYSLESAQDGIIIALLFEGVNPKDIARIEYANLIETKLNLTSRCIELPKDCVELYHKAYSQESHMSGKKSYELQENKYLIKSLRTKEFSDRGTSQRVHQCITRLNNTYGRDISSTRLELSGKYFYLSLIEKSKTELSQDDYKKVIYRYDGGYSQVQILQDDYNNYKISDKYDSDIDISLYDNIYLDIINTQIELDAPDTKDEKGNESEDDDKQGDKHLETLKKIGKMGETIALNYLQSKNINFKYNNVKLESNDFEKGYDIKADDIKYEVKTTTKSINTLEISYHELETAHREYESGNQYKLFFIKINESKSLAEGYIFDNIFDAFQIKWSDMFFPPMPYSNVKVEPYSYRITLQDNFFSSLAESKIELNEEYCEYLRNKNNMDE
jgi:hypothetical protein